MSGPLNLFLMRGLVREAAHWGEFRDAVAAAFPGSNVYCLECLGCGRYWRERTPSSIGEIVERSRRDLLEAAARPEAQGKRAAIFAVSLGGMIAFEWLRRYPQDFWRAVLGNTSLRTLSPFAERLRPACYPTIVRALATRDPLARERAILSLISNAPDRREDVARRWAEIGAARPVSTGNFLRQLVAAARYAPPLERPATPVLLLNGRGDRLVSPRASERVSRALGFPLRVHPDAGHDLALDAPEWVIAQLREFFSAGD